MEGKMEGREVGREEREGLRYGREEQKAGGNEEREGIKNGIEGRRVKGGREESYNLWYRKFIQHTV
jgi:hypothetical protein